MAAKYCNNQYLRARKDREIDYLLHANLSVFLSSTHAIPQDNQRDCQQQTLLKSSKQ